MGSDRPEGEPPFIELRGVTREFPAGEGVAAVLSDINLTIERGEMVAIVGASGSGKSTLMNILGCLDRPSRGGYRVMGRETRSLDPDELAALRRERFGFVFQRYHLLAELSALGNVEIPAIYAGASPEARRARAQALLARLGMGDKSQNRPGQLSGGQQQRVSIARALMNGGEAILADEPTGALDSRSGEEVLRILEELNAEGRAIVIVTHDMEVARRAERIVEIADGRIVSDRLNPRPAAGPGPDIDPQADPRSDEGGAPVARETRRPETRRPETQRPETQRPETRRPERRPPDRRAQGPGRWLGSRLDRLGEALVMALRAMLAHRLRTFLTMLGIIIGIASVVAVVALGAGSQRKVLENISSLGANTLEIFPGGGFGDVRAGKVRTLTAADATAMARMPWAAAVTPTVSTAAVARHGAVEANALANGVGAAYFDAAGVSILAGAGFDAHDVDAMSQVVVIDEAARDTLFGQGADPLGETLLIGKAPVQVIGVAKTSQRGFGGADNLSLYLPYTTVQARFLGDSTLRSITVRVDDAVDMGAAEQAAEQFLIARHGSKDFFILNTDDIRRTITATTRTLTLLISGIALISLLVGGVGVMNIMLVSVSERTNEIGVRMAVGARRSDILQQFLIEAAMVCLIGGALGVGLALSLGPIVALAGLGVELVYAPSVIVLAVVFSTLIGLVFGYLPARGAARMEPVAALQKG